MPVAGWKLPTALPSTRCSTRVGSSDDDVHARIERQRCAVDHQMVKMRIILADVVEDARVPFAHAVHIALSLADVLFVGSIGNRLRDPCFERPIEPDAEHILSTAKDDHAGAAKDDRTCGVLRPVG